MQHAMRAEHSVFVLTQRRCTARKAFIYRINHLSFPRATPYTNVNAKVKAKAKANANANANAKSNPYSTKLHYKITLTELMIILKLSNFTIQRTQALFQPRRKVP